tara:strand:+ start:124 stop:1152 length:1029 start_codon:yes stop_codon:yes gene_type:complete
MKTLHPLKHGSLFSGIGGFDFAAQMMGWENVFHCEWNEFGQKILKYYWPKAITYEDITKTDFNIYRGRIDILTGGFPCQPYSSAGKRLGKEDDRHLWPEMLRAIREIKPRYVVAENVSGLLSWNGGMVFNEVQADLEAQGYEVQPVVLPACAVNAPHRRDRVWFVAYSKSKQSKRSKSEQREFSEQEQRELGRSDSRMGDGINPNTDSNRTLRNPRENESQSQGERLQERHEVQQPKKPDTLRPENAEVSTDTERKRQQEQGKPERPLHQETNSEWKASWSYHDGRWPTQPPICSRNDGISHQLDGITFPKWRQESIKGYGNAIVPQVAYQIFKALIKTDNG